MKHPLLPPLVISVLCLLAGGCAQPDPVYPRAEYHKAGSILMYTPGTELFDGIDKDLCTMCFNRFDAVDSSDVNYLTMDMYVRDAGSRDYRQDEAHSGIGFREFLESRGVKIIRIAREDADRYANNYLTVDARHIMSVR